MCLIEKKIALRASRQCELKAQKTNQPTNQPAKQTNKQKPQTKNPPSPKAGWVCLCIEGWGDDVGKEITV